MNIKTLSACVVAVGLLAASCSTPKNITYMQDAVNGGENINTLVRDIRVRPDDKISIVVNSQDPILADLFNLPVVSHRIGSGSNALSMSSNQFVSFYTVNPDGDIDFPVLGKIHIAGMRRNEVTDYIKNRLIKEDLVKDPVVTMEYANTGISVMGEVNKPGRYDINKDKITILEALSMAGDLTISGQRENILVVRDENGNQKTFRVDLTDANTLYASPAYYLQQDDVIYVEPNKMKKRSTTVNGNTTLSASFWVSIASLLTSVAVLIFK